MEKVSRSNVNNSQVKAQDFPKSGFDLSYQSRADFTLGLLHPAGFQYIMPADKMSGSTDCKYTFNRLVVPEISDVNVSIHNFYVPFRSIDSTFIKGIVPTELNGMSSSWRVPSFSLLSLYNLLDDALNDYVGVDIETLISTVYTNNIISFADIEPFINAVCDFDSDYYLDFGPIWKEYAKSIFPSSVTYSRDNLNLLLDVMFSPILGRNSLLDYLGYVYLRSYDISKLANLLHLRLTQSQPLNISQELSDIPQSEYAIRAYYAIWYDHYRDPFLQKRSNTLPDWRDFGSTSIFTFKNLTCFLVQRFRSWQKDVFVGAMPDDISRHVFAPIYASTTSVDVLSDIHNYMDAEIGSGAIEAGSQGYVNQISYNLKYIDPTTGSQRSILCPIPKAVNDALSTLTANKSSLDSYGLDLRDLRKAQMLERYLKRNFYFGDEYQDRMQAHYGSVVSDNSIRRPHLLSSSISKVNPTQEVSSMSTSTMPAGTRTATAQDASHSDSFEFFAEEFGIVITIISFIPRAQYAPICPQNLLSQMTDFPIPEFANNNDEFGRVCEIALSGLKGFQFDIAQFGHYPYAHAWRSRVDEVHGSFLDDRSDYTFRRFFGLDTQNTTPTLNYKFIACIPNLGMFADQVRLNGQGYYTADHHFYVERVLPTPVEEI